MVGDQWVGRVPVGPTGSGKYITVQEMLERQKAFANLRREQEKQERKRQARYQRLLRRIRKQKRGY